MVYKYNIFCKINFVNGVEKHKKRKLGSNKCWSLLKVARQPSLKKTVPYVSAHARNSLKRPPSYQSSSPPTLRQLFLFLPPVPYIHTHSPIVSPDLCPHKGSEEKGFTILKPSWSIRTRNTARYTQNEIAGTQFLNTLGTTLRNGETRKYFISQYFVEL